MHTIPNDLRGSVGEPTNIRLVEYSGTNGAPGRNPVTLTRHALSLVQAGEKRVYLPSRVLRCSAGEVLLLPAGRCLMSERGPTEESYRSTLLFFDDAHLHAFLCRYATGSLHQQPAAGESPPEAFCFGHTPFLRHYSTALHAWVAEGQPGGDHMLRLKTDELLLYLATTWPAAFGRFVAGVAGAPAAFRQAVENPATQDLLLAELAFLCHMSLATFKRRFHAAYGVSPDRWRQRRRLQQAQHLLQRPDARPSDVYEAVGYENLSSFSHAFKQAFGYTPRQYQRAHMSV